MIIIVIVRDAHRSLFVMCKQEEVQEDFVDQRVFDDLFSETQHQML